jgi:hypothetical protein
MPREISDIKAVSLLLVVWNYACARAWMFGESASANVEFLYSSLRFADARMLPVCYSLARRGPPRSCATIGKGGWSFGLGEGNIEREQRR